MNLHCFISALPRAFVAVAAIVAVGSVQAADTPRLSVTQHEDRVTVNIDGQLFTEYLTCSGRRPVLWPVIGPTGKPMTRAYPMGDLKPGESNDHPHHRSIWLGSSLPQRTIPHRMQKKPAMLPSPARLG